jgi:hypothetical protein
MGAQTGPKNPRVSQRVFAAGLASGLSQEKAYAKAYPNNKGKRESIQTNAKRAARSPKVKAEVSRLLAEDIQLRIFPDAENPAKLRAHAVATMVRLSQSADEVIAMRASDWLTSYAEKREAIALPGDTPRAELFHDLSQLYRKALSAPQPAIVEAVAEEAAEPEAFVTENTKSEPAE